MFKFIKELFKKKEPEKDFEIVEEEEKTKQEVIYSKEKEERTRLNYRTIMLTGTSIEKLTETINKTDTKTDYTKVHVEYNPIKHKEIEK